MSETYQFGLPLLAGGQAQKHVTVNEALARLDALAQLRVVSVALTIPPTVAVDGQAFVVASIADGEWSGHDGQIALWANGGWVYLLPRVGWTAWCEASGGTITFDGVDWQSGSVSVAATGAATQFLIKEVEHVVSAGPISTIAGALPGGTSVLGVTGRVVSAIGGASSWSLGTADSANRYGGGLGVALNSWASGLTAQPMTYYSDTDLILTSAGGDFSAGTVRLAIHYARLQIPRSV